MCVKKLLLLPLLLAIGFAGVSALELSSEGLELCATDTGVLIFTVSNTANFQDSFTVSLSDTASKWAVSAPAGFSLKPGEFETVYVYVTPSRAALPGDYNLKVMASSVSSVESAAALVTVKDCHSAQFDAANEDAQICSATSASYDLTLENTGKYTENFVLSLSGTGAKFSTLSDELIRLSAGESATLTVTATPPADQTGGFTVAVTAASQNSNAVAKQSLTLKSDACYDFSADADVNYVSFCENSEASIPLVVENSGSVDNRYSLSVEGPAWATVEDTSVAVPAGEARFTNVVLFPGFGVSGDYPVTVTIKGDKGSDTVEQEIVANIKSCHSADVKLSVVEDVMCPNTEILHTVSLVNTGEFDAKFAVNAVGASFASLDADFIDLAAGESAEFNLMLSPKEADAGSHTVVVAADAQEASKASAKAELDLTVASLENCFGVQTTAALRKVEVAAGEPAVIPIIVENKGLENSTYDIEVSGTGAQFVQLNPASLVLEGKSAETVYAYIAVPEETAVDLYKVTVAARLKDGTLSSADSFDIAIITEGEAPADVSAPEEEDRAASARAAIMDFFSRIKAQFQLLADQIRAKLGLAEPEEVAGVTNEEANETEEEAAEEVDADLLSDAAKEKLGLSDGEEAAEDETGEQPLDADAAQENDTEVLEAQETNETEAAPELEANETSESLNESAAPETGANETEEAAEEPAAEETAEEINETVPDNLSQFLSGAAREKLAAVEGSELPSSEESAEERLEGSLGRITGYVPSVASVSGFLQGSVYFGLPNWLFIIIVVFIVTGLSYALRRKDLMKKFNDFLEDSGEEEKKDGKGNSKKLSAQEILDEAEKENKNKKKSKKK
jgi:uncharacterized membrane protein